MLSLRTIGLVVAGLACGGCSLFSRPGFVQPVQVDDPDWFELYRESDFVVSLDVAHVEPEIEPDTFAVWYKTDWLIERESDGGPWNREIIRSLLGCDSLRFKTVRVTVFLDEGPPVDQEGGSIQDARSAEWRTPVPATADSRAMRAACEKITGGEAP